MTSCKFKSGDKKLCGKETDGGQFCAHHSTMQCVSCHGQATRNCPHEKNSVCGCPLCNECEHREVPNGANGMLWQHAKPGEEIVVPHYAKDVMKAK